MAKESIKYREERNLYQPAPGPVEIKHLAQRAAQAVLMPVKTAEESLAAVRAGVREVL